MYFPFRQVTEEGGGLVVCTCLDIKSVKFFRFLKNSNLQLGMVEHLKVRQNYPRIKNHYFRAAKLPYTEKKKESLVTKPSLLKESLIIPEESMHFIRRSSLIFW